MDNDRIARARELMQQRDKIDQELATLRSEIENEVSTLFGVAPKKSAGVGRGGGTRKCSICIEEGHPERAVGHNARGHAAAMEKLGITQEAPKKSKKNTEAQAATG